MRRDDLRICDMPGCGATVPDDAPQVVLWDVLTGNDAPDADLCPACAERRPGGKLSDAA